VVFPIKAVQQGIIMYKSPIRIIALFAFMSMILILTGCSGEPIGATTTQTPSNNPVKVLPTPDTSQGFAEAPKLSGKVVYQSSVSPYNIFVLDLTTSQSKQLTNDDNSIEPVWSPDGNKIAYACGNNSAMRQLCVMDADGNNKKTLTNSPGSKWGAEWSPNGKQIAFVSNEIPYAHIFIFDLDSSKIRRLLANSPGNESSPKWSPDGQWIAYSSDRKGFNLFMANNDGTQEKQITTGNTDDRISWSQDGKIIVFRRIAKESSFFNGNEIMKMDLEKKDVVQMTDNTFGDDWPSFSPDGKWVIYSAETKVGVVSVLVIPASGGRPAPITKEGVDGSAPHWKP
jgi:TolB protein